MKRPQILHFLRLDDRSSDRGRRAVVLALAASFAALFPSSAAAQSSRAESIAMKQAEKAREVRRYQPSKAERIVVRFKQGYLSSPNGFYPLFGSVYSGGGFALGAGYRQYYGDNTFAEVKGLWSIRNYKWIEVGTSALDLGLGKVSLHARGGWRDATQIGFYGLGTNTSVDDRVNYRMKLGYVSASAEAKPAFPVVLAAGVAYEDYKTESGLGRRPSIEERFDASQVIGLGADAAFVHTSAQAGIDWRPSAGYARTGGLYELRYHNFSHRDDVFSFDRLDAEVVQHVPMRKETWVLSLRGRLETILDDQDRVPYFMLPSLGSGSTLRGYSSWRFRDRHSLLLQAEWRWVPNRYGMDMALFYDAGKVTSRRSALDFDGLKSNVGIGVRFHGPTFMPVRIELARGNEGLKIVFAGSAAF